MSFSVEVERGVVTALEYRAPAGAPWLVLAHGAGADQRSAWMVRFAEALRERGVNVLTFNFPYTEQRRRAPDRAPVLEDAWRRVVSALVAREGASLPRLCVGGKSMGGRIASHVVSSGEGLRGVAGLVLLGYPLHPPGRPERPRTAHLPALATPTLVVQGTRDDFGGPEDVREAFAVCPGPVEVMPIEDGDHSFKVRGGAARQHEVMTAVYERVAAFVLRRTN